MPLMLNVGQLSSGWQSTKDRARLLSLSRKAHGFQYRVTDKRAGIAMSLMYNLESMALEVLCNDKVNPHQMFHFLSLCIVVILSHENITGTGTVARRSFAVALPHAPSVHRRTFQLFVLGGLNWCSAGVC